MEESNAGNYGQIQEKKQISDIIQMKDQIKDVPQQIQITAAYIDIKDTGIDNHIGVE